MDGLWPRIDVRPEVKIPEPVKDRVDEDPRYNTYPEFVEGDDWTPGHVLPQVRSLEYRGNTSKDLSSDMEAALTVQAVSISTALESEEAKPTAQDARTVELMPLPGLEQFSVIEKEIQCRIQQESQRLVRDVLRRSTSLARPPPSSDST